MEPEASLQKVMNKQTRASRFVAGRKITPVIIKVKSSSLSDKISQSSTLPKSKSEGKRKRSNSAIQINTETSAQKETCSFDLSESGTKKQRNSATSSENIGPKDINQQDTSVLHKSMKQTGRHAEEKFDILREKEVQAPNDSLQEQFSPG